MLHKNGCFDFLVFFCHNRLHFCLYTNENDDFVISVLSMRAVIIYNMYEKFDDTHNDEPLNNNHLLMIRKRQCLNVYVTVE